MTKKPRHKPIRFMITSALLIGPAIQGCNLEPEEPMGNEMAPVVEAPVLNEMEEPEPEPNLEAPRPGVAPPGPHLEGPSIEAPDPGVEAPDPGVEAPEPEPENVGRGTSVVMGTNAVAPHN